MFDRDSDVIITEALLKSVTQGGNDGYRPLLMNNWHVVLKIDVWHIDTFLLFCENIRKKKLFSCYVCAA